MESRHRSRIVRITTTVAVTTAILFILFWILASPPPPNLLEVFGKLGTSGEEEDIDSWCPLPDPVSPSNYDDSITLPSSSQLSGEEWIQKQVKRLSAAINVPTESYDDNGDVDEDPRWKPFDKFHALLHDLFPNVHKNANITHVNRYGLVYTLKGASNSLKPIVLAAHQDVVPAGPADKWTHPPFDAYFDGSFLWGRGSSDCKSNLIGILSTMEFLLEKDWTPSRTVILAFGFDEETGGVRGAAKIAEYLQDTWGKDGIELILDEGGMGLQTLGNYVYARPGVAEKGYTDVILTLDTSGGHSSKPPSHSGIGIMAEIIVLLEENPYMPKLTKSNPFRGVLECQAKYSPDELEPWLRKALQRNERNLGLHLAETRGQSVRFSMQTSQAVDVIRGGVKVNALPETVTTMVNYRIAPHESLEIVKNNIETHLSPIAQKHNISILNFSAQNTIMAREVLSYPSAGTLALRSNNDLSPSPITPTNAQTDAVWRLFSATIRSVFEVTPSLQGKKVIPVGDIMTGNTDTMHYWNLTRDIYRFSPRRDGTNANVHTVDERVEMESHLEGMRFYYDIIRNFDEWTG